MKVQEFLSKQQKKLMEKYATLRDEEVELGGVVSRFLETTYTNALELAETISLEKRPVILFIGIEDCPICKKGRVELDELKRSHAEVEIFILDYNEDPSGLLYHMIEDGDLGGPLPLIAMIHDGCLRQVWRGEVVTGEEYERCLGQTDLLNVSL